MLPSVDRGCRRLRNHSLRSVGSGLDLKQSSSIALQVPALGLIQATAVDQWVKVPEDQGRLGSLLWEAPPRGRINLPTRLRRPRPAEEAISRLGDSSLAKAHPQLLRPVYGVEPPIPCGRTDLVTPDKSPRRLWCLSRRK